MGSYFQKQLNHVANAAQLFITERCQYSKDRLIEIIKDFNEEDSELFDDIPDFPFYDKTGKVEYAAVKDVQENGTLVIVTGILKGDSFPKEVTVSLPELDAFSSAVLADYLSSNQHKDCC